MISLETKFDKAAYTRFFWYDSVMSWRFLPFIMAELAAWTMLLDNLINDKPYKLLSGIVVLAVVAAWYFSRRHRLKYTLRAGGLQDKTIRMQYNFTESKITAQNKTTGRHSSYKWSDIIKVRQPGKALYLYLSGGQALILDKRELGKAQIDLLLEYAAKGRKEAEKYKDRRKALNKTSTKKGN